jgi:hypothetical protein
MTIPAEQQLRQILLSYQTSFSSQQTTADTRDPDILMKLFGVTSDTQKENRQFWGRHLGVCWEKLVTTLFKSTVPNVQGGYRQGRKTLCDLIAGTNAIDTKYRIATSQPAVRAELQRHGGILQAAGYNPVLLVLREDNLRDATQQCEKGGWRIYAGAAAFEFINAETGTDLYQWLTSLDGQFAFTAAEPVKRIWASRFLRGVAQKVDDHFAIGA